MATATKELAQALAALVTGLAAALGEWAGGMLYDSMTRKGKRR